MSTLFLALALPTLASVSAELSLDEPVVAGQPATLILRRDGAAVAAIEITAKYRQNAHEALRHEQIIGVTSTEGQLQWIPDQAGVAVLTYENGSHNVAVRHQGVPLSGLLIALFAGLLLVGGSAYMLVRMLRPSET